MENQFEIKSECKNLKIAHERTDSIGTGGIGGSMPIFICALRKEADIDEKLQMSQILYKEGFGKKDDTSDFCPLEMNNNNSCPLLNLKGKK